LNTINQRKQNLKKVQKDENDHKIDKYRGINTKLTSKMKELNSVLEKTLEKANSKKQAKDIKNMNVKPTDTNHQLKVKE
jgi:hypothetical protein|tara:strand:+ start:309 stop:545 length:237 start_codon:yes stop_codon:yes gene_type:complete